MRYSIDTASKDPADWKLLRYGEPAGTATERPGSFDNAHLEFWQEIEQLQDLLKRVAEGGYLLDGDGCPDPLHDEILCAVGRP